MVTEHTQQIASLHALRPSPGAKESRDGVILVLGSGGSRGIVHIGVIQALQDLHIPIRAIVGCSMGALVGAFYASGMDTQSLVDLTHNVSLWDVLRIFAPAPWSSGLHRGKGVDRLLCRYLGEKDLRDFRIPFVAVATNLQTGNLEVLDHGTAWSTVRASLSLPGIFPPHEDSQRGLLIDGAFVDPLPVSVARARFSGPVIAVQAQLHPSLRKPILPRLRFPFAWLKVSQYAQDTVLWELAQARLRESPPDLLLTPPLYGFGCFQYHNSTELIRIGREYANAHASEIKALPDNRNQSKNEII